MGGYGATRIGMKHADVFGSLYIVNPCCLALMGAASRPGNAEMAKAIGAVNTPADSVKLPFGTQAQMASAAP